MKKPRIKPPNSGRQKGSGKKIKRTYSIDAELANCKIESRVVNRLLREEYLSKKD